jgi:hypothetical protein
MDVLYLYNTKLLFVPSLVGEPINTQNFTKLYSPIKNALKNLL